MFGFRVHQSARQQNNVAALTASALRSSNGRRGNVDSFTSQRVVKATEEGVGAAVGDVKDRTGTEVEVKKKSGGVEDGQAQQQGDRSKSSDTTSKGEKKKGSNGDGAVKEDKAEVGEGNTSKRKGKEGDNSAVSNNENGGSSKSRSSKRQKRQAGSEVT